MPDQPSYKQVAKATSVFGGVQVFNIIISVVRSKVIAIFLGPSGMGIAGLFNSAIGLIGVMSNFGLDTSAIKSISVANETDQSSVGREVAILKRLTWITGTLGALLTVAFSPLLSRLTFGNDDYTFSFVWIAAAVLVRQLSVGQLAVLQGLRKIQYLAKANLLGSFFGLIVTVPLYYFFRIDAIVPAVIVTVVVSFVFNGLYVSKIHAQTVSITTAQALTEGRSMLTLGLSLSFITIITTLAAYALQIFIGRSGGLHQVGLFNAGFAIINSYVGLVFNAMATDYFPRLSAISQDKSQTRIVVTQQAFMAVLIMTPIVAVFLFLAPFIVEVLYSKEFLPIVMLVSWGILGMLFKAVSWSMGYILIAKSDSKLFIATSIGFNSVFLATNFIGYSFYGLEGLGISFFVNHFIHFIVLKIITRRRYGFYFDSEFHKIYTVCLLICGIGFLFTYISNLYLKYGLLLCVVLAASGFCLYQLNNKVNLIEIINNKRNRK
jgi:O-antigen/teichoic acid export membrane protein